MATLREEFGRPLRIGFIGGGPESWIGFMHRSAAELDGMFELVAGVFSSDPARSAAKGRQLGIADGRAYGDIPSMLAAERDRQDGIDAVAVMTPNDDHYGHSRAAIDAGYDVISDKPITRTLSEAQDLGRRVRSGKRIYAITHAYSAYPMTRLAASVVRDGTIGKLRYVQVEYIQSGLATKLEVGPKYNRLKWVLDPSRSGLALVMSAIGCHAQHLACFACNDRISETSADVASLLPGREVVDYVSANLRMESGAHGQFIVTQATAGGENDIRLRIAGDNGVIDWNHRDASYLRVSIQGEPSRTYGRGDTFLAPDIIASGRSPRGHPEGLREAFANIYHDSAEDIIARNLGRPAPSTPGYPRYPTIDDGIHTMAFIEACIASNGNNGQWTRVAA
jgi:predicted dehydrogenase